MKYGCRLFIASFTLTFLLGCSAGRGDVAGKVRVGKKQVLAGRVTFISEGGNQEAISSPILDGQYRIVNCPVGRAKIIVETFPPRPPIDPETLKKQPPKQAVRAMGLDPDAIIDYNSPPGKHVEIPRRYSDFSATDLFYDVRRGPQDHDIEMKP